ncbi:enoyl-CoA hydratase-related protein [Rhodococcoides yunnanense]|uniref:enoyl-CoA hydratase-related protein n=1 Tax=Rhodococcoides yunnanense TaxID=278209 RepID=UPI0009343F21|nr:enoyl-CoA hydratase-related protein [Rhodococcus yunnanensis]
MEPIKRIVDVDIGDRVATITLNSPHNRNALSRALLVQLADALRVTSGRDDVSVVVLTGVDPVFCAGADLKEQTEEHVPNQVGLIDIMVAIDRHTCPVVARVAGPARAGGIGLLAACDIAIGLTDATFAFTEVKIGVVPAVISLPVFERMGTVVAHQYFLTGETFSAIRAAETGLLNAVVAASELDNEVDRIVGLLKEAGPNASTETKKLRRRYGGPIRIELLNELQTLSTSFFASGEGQEGIAAFREKRTPAWMQFAS